MLDLVDVAAELLEDCRDDCQCKSGALRDVVSEGLDVEPGYPQVRCRLCAYGINHVIGREQGLGKGLAGAKEVDHDAIAVRLIPEQNDPALQNDEECLRCRALMEERLPRYQRLHPEALRQKL